MSRGAPILENLLCLGILLAGTGCGAGLIAGVASTSDSGGGSEARAPELSISPLMPLVPAENTVRTVVVANAQIAAAARLRVRIEALGIGVDQRNPSAAGQGGSTLISFTLDTAAIAAAAGDPTAADVPGQLDVFVDDQRIAPPTPVLLARQPQARLVLDQGMAERFVSPLGERVRIEVDNLRSVDASGLQMFVTTADPSRAPGVGEPWPTVTRLCTDLQLEPATGTGGSLLSAIVPGSTFPTSARMFVQDAIAGQSTTIDNAYYRPDIALALPSQGPTTGGSLVTLIGTALVPLDLTGSSVPAPLAFADIELSFAKGGRVTTLAPEDFRPAESGTDRLVFSMPASPDGRPGQVDVVLRARLGAVTAQIAASQVFLFANPRPYFGPRGAILDRTPVAVVPILLDAAPGAGATAVPDFAVLTEQGGVGFLQLLLAQQNGMFQPFAAPRQIGDHEVAAERGPRDLCSGDFDGDDVPDMFLANEGAATAVHHLVLGRARPATPLGPVHRVDDEPGAARCLSADFDRDGLSDVLLVPGPAAPVGSLPRIRLSRPLGPGQPAFAPAVHLPVRALRHEAVEIADLDGDGFLDVALLRGATLQLDIAYGSGDGTFAAAPPLDFAAQGYTPDPRSSAVGLHACRNGTLQSLGIVMAGLPLALPEAAETPPMTAVLDQIAPRAFAAPAAHKTQLLPTEPLGKSLLEDLDGVPPVELAVSIAGDPILISLGLLRLGPNGFLPVPGGVETGAELPKQIRALHFGRAFAPTPISPEARAVFVVHESDIDGERERRLSTRLVYADSTVDFLTLLPPDAGAIVAAPIEGIVGGNFHPVSIAGAGLVRDLALARSGAVDLIENDGYGGFPRPSNSLSWSGLMPRSMTLLPAPAGQFDRLAFAAADSRLGVWRHDPAAGPVQAPDHVSMQLRTLFADPALRALPLGSGTRMRAGDVDGDGVDDLVVLLAPAGAPVGEGGAGLALLRGKAAPPADEFPFHEPSFLTPVHSGASAIALGDFAVGGDGPARLELAVAVPYGTGSASIDGDHVRFFRYQPGATPSDDRFEPSFLPSGAQVLLAGSRPTKLVAGDFDRDGRVDLLVAGAGDSSLRLFRNVSLPAPGQPHVDVDSFLESLASPQPMPPGQPTSLHLADVNGDGNRDVVAVVEFQSSSTSARSTSVAFYLSTGAGEFVGPQFVSPTRVGDRDARLVVDTGDWNRDAVPDLFLGWSTSGFGDRNLRVLFGGTR